MEKDAYDNSLEILLRQIGHGYFRAMQQKMDMEEVPMRGGQAGVLFCLHCAPKLSQREIARRLGLTASTVTTAIQKLEGLGYLERQQDETDHRVLRLVLTPKGEGYIVRIIQKGKEINEAALKGINTEERLLLYRLLRQMNENLKEGTKKR
ncbi:MAG: MarR family transcriptional regulator [Lachnospiraceae bacterium]|nr:MarR family transcriptional regulator [Lachnospiraceae bacterium]